MTTLITGSDGSLGSELMKHGPCMGITGGDIEKGKRTIEKAIDTLLEISPIFRVVNNHGTNHLSWIGTTEWKDADIFNVNVLAPYWVINHLVKRGQTCRVLNVASATYRIPQRCTTLYCASKAALVHMTRVMARELAPKGWVINAIAPGLMPETKMAAMTNVQVHALRGWDPEIADRYAMSLIPMGRPTSTKEVAEAIWKIMDLPDYINGTVIDMMGGV